MEAISQRQLERAAVEAEGLELDHGSDLSRVLGRDGIQFDDLLYVANAFASMATTQRFDSDPTGMSERDLRLTYEATLAASVRGFAAALQLRRVVDSSSAAGVTRALPRTKTVGRPCQPSSAMTSTSGY